MADKVFNDLGFAQDFYDLYKKRAKEIPFLEFQHQIATEYFLQTKNPNAPQIKQVYLAKKFVEGDPNDIMQHIDPAAGDVIPIVPGEEPDPQKCKNLVTSLGGILAAQEGKKYPDEAAYKVDKKRIDAYKKELEKARCPMDQIYNLYQQAAEQHLDFLDDQEKKKAPKVEQINSLNDLILGKELGSGSFGTTYKAVSKKTGNNLVVKKIKKSNAPRSMYEDEVNILKYIKSQCSEYLLCIFSNFEDASYFYIVTELIDGSIDMSDYIKKYASGLGHLKVKQIAINMFRGLKKLHDLKVFHSDIKPANMMINPTTLDVKIIDFGMSCYPAVCKPNIQGLTRIYYPSEFFDSMQYGTPIPHDKKIKGDIFAMGISLAELAATRNIKSPLFGGIDVYFHFDKWLGTDLWKSKLWLLLVSSLTPVDLDHQINLTSFINILTTQSGKEQLRLFLRSYGIEDKLAQFNAQGVNYLGDLLELSHHDIRAIINNNNEAKKKIIGLGFWKGGRRSTSYPYTLVYSF